MNGKQPVEKGKEVVQGHHEEETVEVSGDDLAQAVTEMSMDEEAPWRCCDHLVDDPFQYGKSSCPAGHTYFTADSINPWSRIVDFIDEDYPEHRGKFCKEILASRDEMNFCSFHRRAEDFNWINQINEHYKNMAKRGLELGVVPAKGDKIAVVIAPREAKSQARRRSSATKAPNAFRPRDDQWKCCKCKRNNKLVSEQCASSKDSRCNRHKRCGKCIVVQGTYKANEADEADIAPVDVEDLFRGIRRYNEEDN